ncbi:MAG: FG-GAP repeat protein [Verrucomicrobiales bacterium]
MWNQQAYIKASNTESEDYFGYSLVVSGDTLVVGAVLESSSATGVNGNQSNNSASGSGAAYVLPVLANRRCSSGARNILAVRKTAAMALTWPTRIMTGSPTWSNSAPPRIRLSRVSRRSQVP